MMDDENYGIRVRDEYNVLRPISNDAICVHTNIKAESIVGRRANPDYMSMGRNKRNLTDPSGGHIERKI